MEVANYFLRKGSNPIITLLDCTKAFDKCRFDLLFAKMLDRGMPPIVIRALIYVYEEQFAWVRWGNSKSSQFRVTNGTRQGSVLSPALFAVYMDGLLQDLRRLGVGCHVQGVYMGAVGFCDDILLLAPSRSAMEDMLALCESFAVENNLQFSTDPNPEKSKTKCIFVCGRAKNLQKPTNLKLYGVDLPWVQSANHLGHVLNESGTMETDANVKRAQFIGKSTEIRETFGFAAPSEVLSAVKLYTCDLYGAMLWDLYGGMADKVYKAWNTCIKLAWHVPRSTHTYLLDHLLDVGLCHIRTDILTRYCKFFKRLLNSASTEVRIMANISSRDIRSTTGSNIRNLEAETKLDLWSASPRQVRKVLEEKVVKVPDRDKWRIGFLGRLLTERGDSFYRGEEVQAITELIDSLCSS